MFATVQPAERAKTECHSRKPTSTGEEGKPLTCVATDPFALRVQDDEIESLLKLVLNSEVG